MRQSELMPPTILLESWSEDRAAYFGAVKPMRLDDAWRNLRRLTAYDESLQAKGQLPAADMGQFLLNVQRDVDDCGRQEYSPGFIVFLKLRKIWWATCWLEYRREIESGPDAWGHLTVFEVFLAELGDWPPSQGGRPMSPLSIY